MPRGDGLRLPCGAGLAHWPLLVSNRMGAHTAMCAGRVLVLLSILILLLLLTPPTEDVEMFMRLGVLFGSLMDVNLSLLRDTHVHTVRHGIDKHVEGLFFCHSDRVT